MMKTFIKFIIKTLLFFIVLFILLLLSMCIKYEPENYYGIVEKVDYETGKEVVISANGQIVKDYINQGTSNYYTYGFDKPKLDEGKFDKKLHGLSDVVNYISEGTGVQDETTTLERIDMSILGWLVSANYDGLKKWAVMNNYNKIGYKEYFKYRMIYKFYIDSYKNSRRNMYK